MFESLVWLCNRARNCQTLRILKLRTVHIVVITRSQNWSIGFAVTRYSGIDYVYIHKHTHIYEKIMVKGPISGRISFDCCFIHTSLIIQ